VPKQPNRTFTVTVAEQVSGTVTTYDIDPAMVERRPERAAAAAAYTIQYAALAVCACWSLVRTENPKRPAGGSLSRNSRILAAIEARYGGFVGVLRDCKRASA
jgi:hypothetical protein